MTRRELEVTDHEKIVEILDKCKVLHLALDDNGMPYVLAMNYGYCFEDDHLVIYLHGAKKGYKMDVISQNPNCCFEMDCDITPFEGRIACQYGISYSSIIGRGQARIIDDVEEKMKASTLLMKVQTGKDFEFNEKLVSIMNVVRIDVTEYTAKHRPMPEFDVITRTPIVPEHQA